MHIIKATLYITTTHTSSIHLYNTCICISHTFDTHTTHTQHNNIHIALLTTYLNVNNTTMRVIHLNWYLPMLYQSTHSNIDTYQHNTCNACTQQLQISTHIYYHTAHTNISTNYAQSLHQCIYN